MRKISLSLTLLALSISLTACSTLRPQTDTQTQSLRPAETLLKFSKEDLDALEKPNPNPTPGEFDEDTLYTLLTAEIAGQRNQFDVALKSYLEEARKTHDLNVVIRATRICQYLKKEKELLEMAELWSQLDPKAAEPHHIAAIALIRQREYQRALGHMEKLIALEGSTNFDNLAVHAKTLSPEDRKQLLKLYKELLERHPDNAELMFGYAILQEVNEMLPDTLATLDGLLKHHPAYQPAILMRGRILKEVKGATPALAYLKENTKKYPDNRQLGTLYARMLIDEKQLDAAQEEFRRLMVRFPDAPGLKLSHALVAMENNHTKLARKELLELVDEGQNTNEAYFYLARIADQENQIDKAISYYQKVDRGTHFYTALGRSAYLLAKQNKLDQALASFDQARNDFQAQSDQIWQLEINVLFELQAYDAALKVVNQAIAAVPQDTQLLYTRASLYDRAGDVANMEKDLRKVLSLEPENAVAMNALGYTLADRTDRIKEAYDLIKHALSLKPDNPAIIDSMGWVLYRMGKPDEALTWLRRAFAKFPDPEVAAHLGEVLWVSGKQTEALQIWNGSLADHPGAPKVLEAMKRLGAKPSAETKQ